MSQQSKTVLEYLLEWSLDRSLWQRDALRRIVCKGKLDDKDIRELAMLCKEGKGDAAAAVPAIPLEGKHLPANPGVVLLIKWRTFLGAIWHNNRDPSAVSATDLSLTYPTYGESADFARFPRTAATMRDACGAE